MGVKGLSKFLNKYSKVKQLSDYRGSVFAIDTHIYMYKFKFSGHIDRCFNRQIDNFRNLNIEPIYIFDGDKPVEKQETMKKRKEKNPFFVSHEEIRDVKKLFDQRNVKWYVAPGEGEKFCSYLNREGIADTVLSNDYDCIAFGCKKLLVYQKGLYVEFDTEKILDDLGIDIDIMISMCIMSGTDYCTKGVKNVGITKAFKILKESDTCDIRKLNLKFDDFFSERLDNILNIFKNFNDENTLVDVCVTKQKNISDQ